jgi:hypothetical protein
MRSMVAQLPFHHSFPDLDRTGSFMPLKCLLLINGIRETHALPLRTSIPRARPPARPPARTGLAGIGSVHVCSRR